MHLTWPRRRSRWMLNKQSAYALERSCSTGRGAGSSVGAVVLAVLAARSAVLAKVPGGRKQRAPVRVGASGTVDGRSYVHAEGSRVTLQDRV